MDFYTFTITRIPTFLSFFMIKINFYKNIYVTPFACVCLIGVMKLDHGSNLLIVSTNACVFPQWLYTNLSLSLCVEEERSSDFYISRVVR